MSAIPESLLKASRARRLVPIIGAGVSMSLRNLEGDQLFPSWKKLLELAATKIEAEGDAEKAALTRALLTAGEFQFAADVAKKRLKGSLWHDFLRDTFSIKRACILDESLALPQAIWTISDRIITLNYDKVLRFACPSPDVLEIDNASTSELADFVNGKNNSPTIWHLHGRIDNQAHIVFTTDSYNRLYIEENPQYQAALQVFKAVCRDAHLLFIGCGLEDAELLDQLARQHALFDENSGPHYALVHQNQEQSICEKVKNLPICVVPFEEYGEPLLAKIAKIVSQQLPTGSVEKKTPSVSLGQIRIAILSASPIDKEYQYEEIKKELKKFKCETNFLPLGLTSLNNLEDYQYIFVLTKMIKGKIVIEDESLCSRRLSLKELEDNVGASNVKGIFIFLDHQHSEELTELDLESLVLPTLILPQLNKNQLNSFEFKTFKKKNLEFFENSTLINKSLFDISEIKGECTTVTHKTKLPENIDANTVKKFVGRRTDLENICRKIIELRGESEILTIKGSGGLGKTHSVKKVVVELANRGFFAVGIDFIDCEFISDYKLFEYQVARSFHLEQAVDVKERISESKGKADRLIILDNVETLLHLADSEEIKKFMCFLCEHVTIVATSREFLNLDCEQSYELRSLTTDEACELFISELVNREVSVPEKRFIRGEIVENLLDNNPLAIKLVTKNVISGKSFVALKEELEADIFRKLSDSELHAFDNASDTNIERKKSLFSSINFSYQHLTDKEKMAFELLSLFPDGINLENLKRISSTEITSKNKSARTQSSSSSRELLITDPVVKALYNKSMIQVDNHLIKLQSIIGKFADYQFHRRGERDIKRYCRNAFDYNQKFAQVLDQIKKKDLYSSRKIFNGQQANFIKSIAYLNVSDFEEILVLNYLNELHNLFNAISSISTLIEALEKKEISFESKPAKLCLQVFMLSARYFDGDFTKTFSNLNKVLPFDNLKNLLLTDDIERLTAFLAVNLYSMEGRTLAGAQVYATGKLRQDTYPAELFQIGKIDEDLLRVCSEDFFTFDASLAIGQLSVKTIDLYIGTIYERDHLELMQAHYLKSKLTPISKGTIRKLVVVNPYTKGLKRLMEAFGESDPQIKQSHFEAALPNLSHIKYYYVEALYFYAEFLNEIGDQSRFASTFEEGARLAKEFHYHYLQHRYANFHSETKIKYDQQKYPLLDDPELDAYISYLIKLN